MTPPRPTLYGMTLEELQSLCQSNAWPAFRAKQLAEWLYAKQADSLEQMSNLPLTIRTYLEEHYDMGVHPPAEVVTSTDGTQKYLFTTASGGAIETVYMPSHERHTLCISSQMGCKMGCVFCATGKQGFQHHLSAGEILNQMRSIPESRLLTNIVYMGMGEPFDNIEEVLKSLQILTSPWGYAWSPRRINVSTVGIIPGMLRFIRESEAHLAISLHSPFDYERQKLMPVQNKYPIAEVLRELRAFDWAHQRRLSFEYILFEGVNDKHIHLDALCKMLKGLFCRVNLIRFHSQPDQELRSSSEERMIEFRDYLTDHGIICTIRQSRGEDILAACGLLSTQNRALKTPCK